MFILEFLVECYQDENCVLPQVFFSDSGWAEAPFREHLGKKGTRPLKCIWHMFKNWSEQLNRYSGITAIDTKKSK